MTTNDEMTDLRACLRVIEAFRDLSPTMEMQQAAILLQIALNPEKYSQKELGEMVNITTSAAQRNVNALGTPRRAGLTGHGLVMETEDLNDTRRKLYRLTAKGRAFAAKITGALR